MPTVRKALADATGSPDDLARLDAHIERARELIDLAMAHPVDA